MPHPPLKLLRASAGSGKTFSLVAHYLTLLFSGTGKYREILAVTFTNKATAEMKERILNALQDLANGKQTPFRELLKAQYPLLADEEVRKQAKQIYRSILHDYSRFSVSTIDKFVQQVIRSFAFELNLDSGYKLEMNQEKVKDELVKSLNLLLEKDPELLQWVTGLAIDRINDAKDWNYQRALKELADEIFKERYYPFQEAMLAMGTERGSEFNSLKEVVNSGIREFKKNILEKATGVKQIFDQSGVIADELANKSRHPILKLHKVLDGEYEFIASHLSVLMDDYDKWPNKVLKNPAGVESLFEKINPVLKDLVTFHELGSKQYYTYQAIHKNSSYLRLMQEMADLLKNYRSENRTLLISDAQQLLKGITNSAADNPSFIWEKTGTRFKHFLFDEFQDTSIAQWINFLPLLKNAISESDRAQTEHLIVGDVKQSIYRWRNGDWRILHSQATEDIKSENIIEENLEFNRRSNENIIRFNNFLHGTLPQILQDHINKKIEDNGNPDVLQFWSEEYNRIILEAYRRSAQQLTDKTLPGGKIEIDLLAKDEELEEGNLALALQYMGDKIIHLLKEGVCRMKDICILVRKNTEAGDVIHYLISKQNELSEAAGKTFQVISGEALKIENNIAVQLLLNTMRMLAAREDENSIFKTTCARLVYELDHPDAEKITLSENDWIRLAAEPVEKLAGLLPAELCQNFIGFKQLPVTELTEKLINIYGLGSDHISSHIPYLLAFRDQVALFSAGGDQGLNAFTEWWETEGSGKALPSSESQDAVNVMTVHKSKGLEFNAIILPFCNWNFNTHDSYYQRKLLWVNAADSGFDKFSTLPVDYASSLGATAFAKNYFEEMLLSYMDTLNTFYVATTRAKAYLYLISPQKKGYEYNLFDVLNQVLKAGNEYQSEFIAEEGKLEYGDFAYLPEKKEERKIEKIEISNYPVNDTVSENFTRRHLPSNAWYNDQQRKGTILHEILSVVKRMSDIDKILEGYIQEGQIRESEKEYFLSTVSQVLSQEDISRWFSDSDQVISEQDILVEDGHSLRPDKLFVMKDKAILLDFKFGEEQAKYGITISNYRDNLLKMGEFQSVDAYIWYAKTQTLQKI